MAFFLRSFGFAIGGRESDVTFRRSVRRSAFVAATLSSRVSPGLRREEAQIEDRELEPTSAGHPRFGRKDGAEANSKRKSVLHGMKSEKFGVVGMGALAASASAAAAASWIGPAKLSSPASPYPPRRRREEGPPHQ